MLYAVTYIQAMYWIHSASTPKEKKKSVGNYNVKTYFPLLLQRRNNCNYSRLDSQKNMRDSAYDTTTGQTDQISLCPH